MFCFFNVIGFWKRSVVNSRGFQVRDEAEEKERKKREKEEKEAMKVLLRDQRRRIRNKCEELEMNRSHTEDLSLALPLEQVRLLHDEWPQCILCVGALQIWRVIEMQPCVTVFSASAARRRARARPI